MPITSPMPGGPPQGPHRPVQEISPAVPEGVSKVARAAGQEGTAASKMKTVSREKLPTDSSWLSRLANWLGGLFQAVFGSKSMEVISNEVTKESAEPVSQAIKTDFRARFQELPPEKQRECLMNLMEVFQEKGVLGKQGLFRVEGNNLKTVALKETLLKQMHEGEVGIKSEDIDELTAAYKTFLGAYLNKTLTNEGYEALKNGRSQEEILSGLSAENREFMNKFFDFYRNFAAQQRENKAMNSKGVAVVFAPSFLKDNDHPMAVVTVGMALQNLLPQE